MSGPTRTEIADYVGDAFGPQGADRSDLLAAAVQKTAPPRVLDQLSHLPERHFRTMQELWPHIPEVPVG